MKNKQGNRKYLFVFVLMTGLFFVAPISYAKTDVSIPIEQELMNASGILEEKSRTGVYLLEPLNLENPMPNGHSMYQIELTGNMTSTINGFDFSQEGTFFYKLFQQIPKESPDFSYDEQVYLVTVYVIDTSNGLQTEVIIENNKKLKVAAAKFINTYSAEKSEEKNMENIVKSDSKTKHAEEDLNNSGQERRLLRTGELVEHIWLLGLGLLLVIYFFYQRKKRMNKII